MCLSFRHLRPPNIDSYEAVMITNRNEELFKKQDWLELWGYTEDQVHQNEEGLDFVWGRDYKGTQVKIFLDELELY